MFTESTLDEFDKKIFIDNLTKVQFYRRQNALVYLFCTISKQEKKKQAWYNPTSVMSMAMCRMKCINQRLWPKPTHTSMNMQTKYQPHQSPEYRWALGPRCFHPHQCRCSPDLPSSPCLQWCSADLPWLLVPFPPEVRSQGHPLPSGPEQTRHWLRP